jgi:hypothetical protein
VTCSSVTRAPPHHLHERVLATPSHASATNPHHQPVTQRRQARLPRIPTAVTGPESSGGPGLSRATLGPQCGARSLRVSGLSRCHFVALLPCPWVS